MKHKYLLWVWLLVVGFSLYSCGGDDFVPTEDDADPTTSTNPAPTLPRVSITQDERILLDQWTNKTPKLTQEQAAEIANNFLGIGNDAPSLSKHAALSPQCEVLTRTKRPISKSGNTADVVDTMLYVFNYNDGYAVVSADIRTPEPILAFSEEGNIHLDSDDPGVNLFFDMAQDYIDYHISYAESIRDSVEKSLNAKLDEALDFSDNSSHSLSKTMVILRKELVGDMSWKNLTYLSTEKTGPFITTAWHQKSPYNKRVNEEYGKNCPAGCQAIGISQLLAFWEYPQYMNGKKINWQSIKNVDAYFETNVSNLVYDVGVAMNTKYVPDSSFARAKTGDAISFLKKYGFSMDNLSGYRFSPKIIQSLDLGRPVVIRGDKTVVNDKGKTEKRGHLWLLDGYAKVNYSFKAHETYVVEYMDDWTGRTSIVFEEYDKTGKEYTYYQHFNWGWGDDMYSESKGYYLVSVFDAHDEYIVTSNSEPYRNSRNNYKYGVENYIYSVQVITNIHP